MTEGFKGKYDPVPFFLTYFVSIPLTGQSQETH